MAKQSEQQAAGGGGFDWWEALNNVARPLDSVLDTVLGPADAQELKVGRPDVKPDTIRRRRKPGQSDRRIPPIDLERELQTKAQEAQELYEAEQAAAAQEEADRKAADRGNSQLIAQTTLTQVAGLYAVTQACLLILFVPQKCPLRPAGQSLLFTYKETLPVNHLCTLTENIDFSDNSVYQNAVLLMNVITLLIMLAAQLYFWKRETWMINHLEQDESVPYSNLPNLLKAYPDIDSDVQAMNNGAYSYALAVALAVLSNFVMSTVLFMYGDGSFVYNIGSRTTTGLLTNTMLVSTRVYGYLSYARMSKENGWAISMFTVIPTSYNTIDENTKENGVKPDNEPEV